MKKIVALVLSLLLLLSLASVASAARVEFHIVTSSTSIFQVGTPLFDRNGPFWYLDIDMSTSNVAPDHRAVTRVHQGVNAASATWVYSGPSGTQHNFIEGYYDDLTFRGRLDNRDTGLLEFHGKFYYN